PRDVWPPVAIVRTAFQVMVAIGFLLLGLALWFAWSWWRRRDLPSSKWFLGGAVFAGFAAPAAVEAGWIVTEVGRQPWIVYGLMRVEDAVTRAPNVRLGYFALIVIYSVLTAASVYVLRLLASQPLGGESTSEPSRPPETETGKVP
ncbi:MAG: cytochrome ubiquinol oxidase subunit I, partial [Actinomycetota bacterium]|nr:cytochrome ubiquinol oxidase subunit I [Actinomycetota bacterium]